MKKRGLFARAAVGVVGGILLIGAAGAAIADEVSDGEVDVNVEIDALQPVGALTMTVAQDATSLAEVASTDADVREFTGALPTVTVTDDRDAVPSGVFWYVTGQASDFTSTAGDTITAGHLGWAPRLITDGNGEVAAGDEVGTVLDQAPDNVGLVGEELLALAITSDEAAVQGSWQADAGLTLKTPKDVKPGRYSSTLTLTLWEDAF